MSTISASTTTTTAYKVTADTTGTLVLQTGATPTTAMTISSAQVVNFANTPTVAGSPISASPAGSTTQVQYNNAGAFAGSSNFVFDGTSLGLGGAPSAWGTFKALQIANGTFTAVGTQTQLIQNAYWDGANWKYITSNAASRYGQDMFGGANHYWYTATSGTAGNNITWTTALTLNPNGVLALQGGNASASGVGVAFPATQSASSDANTLDDYEEGTWTPSLGGNTTYTEQIGTYTKVGRLVTIRFRINPSSIGTGSTTTITGLPFTASGAAEGTVYWDTSLTSVVHITAYATSSQINLYSATAASASLTSIGIFKSGTTLDGTITYIV